jgi:hypothetical protein
VKPSANFYIIDFAEGFTFRYISGCLLFTICQLSSLSFLFASTEKNKLNISEFYRDSITFQTNIMHTPTNFDQTVRIGPLARYDGAESNEYLSDSSSCTDNRSDLEPDDYNNYESNYESDNEEAIHASTNITMTQSFQYSLRQEKFNDKFSPKDLLNAIWEILLSPPKDMSDEKGSLEFLPIYSFLFPNEKDSSLYNTYDRGEVENKLVIKIDQDD